MNKVSYTLIFCLMTWILLLFINIVIFNRWSQTIEVQLQQQIATFNERKVWIKSIETRLDDLIAEKHRD